MSAANHEYRQRVALFRYGVIADLCMPSRMRGRWRPGFAPRLNSRMRFRIRVALGLASRLYMAGCGSISKVALMH